MSKIIYICLRNPRKFSDYVTKLNKIENNLVPNNICAEPKIIKDQNGILLGVYNPVSTLRMVGTNICSGFIVDHFYDWWQTLTVTPEGTYTLFRGDERFVEIATDAVASQSIWYYIDENILIASNSQRSIITLLESFQFNKAAISWMLSSGTLGPYNSWDERINLLQGDSILLLNRSEWQYRINSGSITFNSNKNNHKYHFNRLKTTIEKSVSSLKIDYSKWVLTLSGGYDSRAILLFLKQNTDLQTLTWSTSLPPHKKNSDAYIAYQLARYYGLNHKLYFIDKVESDIDALIAKYLEYGEGRIDHISGYIDGFKTWKVIYENGVEGIIRGDENFGWGSVSSQQNVRYSVNLLLWKDYQNLPSLNKYGIEEEQIPESLKQKDESLESWRDRLYQEFRIPIMISALNDLKNPFIEVFSPFLMKSILSTVRNIPDGYRTNKKLFKEVIKSKKCPIKFAKYDSVDSLDSILMSNIYISYLSDELQKYCSSKIIPSDFIRYVADNINVGYRNKKSFKDKLKPTLKTLLPPVVTSIVRDKYLKINMNYNILAFRLLIILKMEKLLRSDSLFFRMHKSESISQIH